MASLLRSVTDQVAVEAGVFAVLDVDTAAAAVLWPDSIAGPGFGMLAWPNRLDLESGVRDVEVGVTLQAWDDAPPATPEQDDVDVEETEVTLSSGTVQVWELTGGPLATTCVLGGPGRCGTRCAVRCAASTRRRCLRPPVSLFRRALCSTFYAFGPSGD